ncbi:hypothetical protein [Methylobacterium phyllostachyos]|nr:hypothetical protein [Methylobacterium phyllostachyos]
MTMSLGYLVYRPAFTGLFDPGTGFLGRLPEGPDLRDPASVAGDNGVEHTRALFNETCAEK